MKEVFKNLTLGLVQTQVFLFSMAGIVRRAREPLCLFGWQPTNSLDRGKPSL